MNIRGHDIGVCSWSLQPRDLADLASQVRRLGLGHVQLAVAPLLVLDADARKRELEHLRKADITLTAGMINFPGEDYSTIAMIRDTGGYVPEKDWPLRQQMTLEAARLGKELGISILSTHVGFIPPSNHPAYPILVQRIQSIAAPMADLGMDLLMETGQESAAELLRFLNDLPVKNVAINFDPANMILYGAGDPIDAVGTLGRHIRHVHVKDGTLSSQPGVRWGEEVPFGTGQVDPERFIDALHAVSYHGPLVIEREAGQTRLEDVQTAIQTLRSIGK